LYPVVPGIGDVHASVGDTWNDRIQYFDDQPVSVTPESLGKIKAIYK